MFSSDQQRDRVLSQMEEVRQSGEINMADATGVQQVAYDKDLFALVSYLGRRPGKGYAEVLEEFEKWKREVHSIDAEHDYAERALDL